LTPKEGQATRDAGLPEAPPADRPVRLLKALTVRIGGSDVTLPPGESAGLVDLAGLRVWRQEAAVYCRLLGRSGTLGYSVTYAFMPLRGGWVRVNRFFKAGEAVAQETREASSTVEIRSSSPE
jgi:hypothetical protein